MTAPVKTKSGIEHGPLQAAVASSGARRLYNGQTAIDFVGRRKIGFILSAVLLVLTVFSLSVRGLDLGIDFEGGISWDVPGNELSIADAEAVLSENGLDPAGARIQRRSSDSGDFIKIQVAEQTPEVQASLQVAFAEAAGVEFDDVSVNVVSSSWGREITDQAVRALLIFTLVVALVISVRYEWRMALAAIVAMVHDVVIAVGIYSLLGFLVTPATVIAFLTILGYSLYDTIVIFDRVRENEARFEARRAPYADVLNTTMNQVLMRTINTSVSSMIPVLSILVIGAGVLGATTLAEFAIALLVGMAVGAYSSLYVAAPLLGMMKGSDERWRGTSADRAVNEELRELVMGGAPTSVRSRTVAAESSGERARSADPVADPPRNRPDGTRPDASGGANEDRPAPKLSHPPRPRKKKRR
jgi:preprotein translocase subunit SecF